MNSFKSKLGYPVYPLAQVLVNAAVCCFVVVVSSLFSFVFYCETMAWASVATLRNNWLLQNKFNVHVRPALYKNRVVRVQYAQAILIT